MPVASREADQSGMAGRGRRQGTKGPALLSAADKGYFFNMLAPPLQVPWAQARAPWCPRTQSSGRSRGRTTTGQQAAGVGLGPGSGLRARTMRASGQTGWCNGARRGAKSCEPTWCCDVSTHHSTSIDDRTMPTRRAGGCARPVTCRPQVRA